MTTFHMPFYDRTGGKLSEAIIHAMGNDGAKSARVDADTISLTFPDEDSAMLFFMKIPEPEKNGVIAITPKPTKRGKKAVEEAPADDIDAGE